MKDAFKATADTEEALKELIEKWQMALLINLAKEDTKSSLINLNLTET
jgi:hypothetical protein